MVGKMRVRFVGKTGRGTLFNFGNPTSQDSPYGFRLETVCKQRPIAHNPNNYYHRIFRLGVRDHINNTFHDNSWAWTMVMEFEKQGLGPWRGVGALRKSTGLVHGEVLEFGEHSWAWTMAT